MICVHSGGKRLAVSTVAKRNRKEPGWCTGGKSKNPEHSQGNSSRPQQSGAGQDAKDVGSSNV